VKHQVQNRARKQAPVKGVDAKAACMTLPVLQAAHVGQENTKRFNIQLPK
jgi:hypothetical protein